MNHGNNDFDDSSLYLMIYLNTLYHQKKCFFYFEKTKTKP